MNAVARDAGDRPAGHEEPRWWQRTTVMLVAGTSVGVLLLAPPLASVVEVGDLAPLVAMFLLLVVLVRPVRLRVPLAGVALLGWTAAIVWDGGTEVPVLVAQVGGGTLVLVTVLRLGDAFVDSLASVASGRDRAEQRARLLVSVARLNTLEPADVLRQVGEALLEVGFDVAFVRTVDVGGHTARLVGSATRMPVGLEEVVELAESIYAEPVRSGRVELLRDDRLRGMPQPLAAMLVVPLLDDDRTVALVSAGIVEGEVDDSQVEAARLLAEQASSALQRAERFEQDERTVAALRALDVRSHDFVSTVSHELRTPLTVIQGLGQTLDRRWDDLTSGQRHDLLVRIEANADRLGAMVGSLLDTATVGSGSVAPRMRAVRLREIFETLLVRFPQVGATHDVQLSVPASMMVSVDPALFEHVVENLLTNVAKYTPAGTTMEIVATEAEGRVQLAIIDDGPGIPAEDLPHVMERFYRGGDPNTRASGGLGLGLALAAEVVRAHGGELQVQSAPGVGTRFSFSVPAAAPWSS